MKYSITISDMTENQLSETISKLNGEVSTTETAPAAQQPASLPPVAQETSTDKDLDADGLPWDERIHSGNKKKKTDGTWTKKRGVNDAEYNQVRAELLAKEQGGALPPVAPVAQQPAPLPPVAPVAPVAQQEIPRDINGLMTKIQTGFSTGKIDANYIQGLLQRLNQHFSTQMAAITDVASRPDILDAAFTMIENEAV